MKRAFAGGWRPGVSAVIGILGSWCVVTGCAAPGSGPIYTTEQTDSAHAGFRRTTVTIDGATYVNDFEEAALELENFDPQEVIAGSRFGGGTVRAIPGQSRTAYVAVDVGSEMPAYAVYRHAGHPPFDWRHATYRKLRLAAPEGPAANKESSDPALLEDVVRTLGDGAPASPPVTAPTTAITGEKVRVHPLLLSSDAIPGLVFRPWVYLADSGDAYLAHDATFEFTNQQQSVRADWIPASPLFTRWAQTP